MQRQRARLTTLVFMIAVGAAPGLLPALHAQPAQTQVQPAVVDINTATEAELDSIRGIGPPMTRSILAERRVAPFEDWQDLMRRVKGIGPARAGQWSTDGLRVQGQAYTGTRTRN